VAGALIAQYMWVLIIFGLFLLITAAKMALVQTHGDPGQNIVVRWVKKLYPVTTDFHGQKFFVKVNGVRHITPLFLALVLIEIADLVFAVDSVPAVFAITTDPYIVYTSNIFAILGLRALYFALAAVLHRFHYLKYALAILLVFIGSKIFVADLAGWEKFPASWSLGITFAILAAGVIFSLWKSRNEAPAVRDVK
jgi:tellurite resistance protein TerC